MTQDESLRVKAAKGGRWTAASAIISATVQILQLAILGRLLGPSEFGLMAMMMIVIGLTNSISDFGLGNYAIQKEKLNQKTAIRLMLIVTGVSTFLAVGVASQSGVIAIYFNHLELVKFIPWLSISIVIFTIGQMMISILQRSFAFKYIAVGDILSAILGLACTTIVAILGYGVWSLVLGQLISSAARLFVFILPYIYFVKKLPCGEKSDLNKSKSFAFYQTGERVLNYISWNIDKIIIARILGDVGLGLYSVAYQFMIKPFMVLNPIFTRVALPVFVSIRADNTRLVAGYLETTRTIALLSFPIYMVMAIMAPMIIEILMGEKWVGATSILYVLSILGMFFSIGNIIGALILAKSKPKWALYLNIYSFFVYSLAFWAGSQFSALGVAVTFLVSNVLALYPMEFFLRHRLVGMTAKEYFLAMRHVFIAMSVPMLAHSLVYLPVMKPSSYLTQCSMAIMAVTFFFMYLILFDRDLIISTKNLVIKGR